ncbi:MAG: hypothetical protein RH917_11455 [Lacipirellulaceae bacterium]
MLACLDSSSCQAGVGGWYEVGDTNIAFAPELFGAFRRPFQSQGIGTSVANDAADGFAGWRVQVPSGTQLPDSGYEAVLYNSFVNNATNQGWWFRSHFRLPGDTTDSSTGMSVYFNNRIYLAYVELNSSNNLQARLVGTTQQTIPLTTDGSGTDYHTFELRANPGGGSGQLFFDGEFLTSWSPIIQNHPNVFKWGDEGPAGSSDIRIRTLAYGWGTPPTDSPADLNLDAAVNGLDLALWSDDYGGLTSEGDITGNGFADGADLLDWQRERNWSLFAPTAIALIPEPSTIVLTLLGLVFWEPRIGRITRMR